MQSGGFNYNNAMNFRPYHQQIDGVPFRNPPIYTSFDLNHQFHQPPPPPVNPPPPPPSGYGGFSDYEQRLRNEVIYLHCLWHRGPPQRQIQNPHFLKPLHTTLFKNNKKKPNDNEPHVVSDKEWPIDAKAARPSSPKQGWGEFKASTSPKTFPVTSQEKDRVSAVRVQLKGLDSFLRFFQKSDEDEDDDDDLEEEEDYDEEEAFEFFFNVFEKDENLRGYYKTKCESGEFYCLVCGGIANKLGRKYKDCVALVQHSVSISKTKKRIAHRAYARLVCKVLGWDVDRLPSLPSTIVQTQSEPPPQPQGEEEKPTAVEAEPEIIEKYSVNRMDGECIANEEGDLA